MACFNMFNGLLRVFIFSLLHIFIENVSTGSSLVLDDRKYFEQEVFSFIEKILLHQQHKNVVAF